MLGLGFSGERGSLFVSTLFSLAVLALSFRTGFIGEENLLLGGKTADSSRDNAALGMTTDDESSRPRQFRISYASRALLDAARIDGLLSRFDCEEPWRLDPSSP
jgi:hypothetical protein